MLTDQHISEALSRAYVRAIAGRAGLNLAIREYDYGVDGRTLKQENGDDP